MLDVGFSEILLTSAIALIVLGPERLPKVARQVGNWMGRARAMARQLSEQLEREVSADELLKQHTKSLKKLNSDSTAAPVPAVPTNVAPPVALAPIQAAAPEAAVAPHVEAASIAPFEPKVRDAASTTAAAMHASDPPIAGFTLPDE